MNKQRNKQTNKKKNNKQEEKLGLLHKLSFHSEINILENILKEILNRLWTESKSTAVRHIDRLEPNDIYKIIWLSSNNTIWLLIIIIIIGAEVFQLWSVIYWNAVMPESSSPNGQLQNQYEDYNLVRFCVWSHSSIIYDFNYCNWIFIVTLPNS